MKKLALLFLLCFQGCTYSTKSIDDRMNAIAQTIGQQNAYLQLVVGKVWASEIKACNDKKQALDLKSGECMDEPKKP